MREVMTCLVVALGVSVLNMVAIGVPVTNATTDGTSGAGDSHITKSMDDIRSTMSKVAMSQGSIGSTSGTSVSNVRVQGTNESGLNSSVEGVVDSTIRMLNERLASSPADVHMSEKGVSGMVKEVGRNLKRIAHFGKEEQFKVLSRNESMIVVGVDERSFEKSRSEIDKVFKDGKHVVVAVKERDRDGKDETREIRIKIGGKYDVESEKVMVVGDEGDRKWGTKIMIVLSEKKMKMRKGCNEKDGGSEIEEDLCRCEKKKDGEAKQEDVECVSGIVKKLMHVSKDNMKVYKKGRMCKTKGMQKRYECVIKMLEKMDEEDGYSSKSHGRSMLSWSGWMEGEEFEEDDDEEGSEEQKGGRGGSRNKMMYGVFLVMLMLVIVCLSDLKEQCGRYRQERGKAYEVVRLPEYGQTIYSRMIRR